MQAAIVIPARYGSTRLPAKPLLKETGKFLVQHVYERAALVRNARRVIVATDDVRILQAVQSFGGEAVMTQGHHATGTDRVAEAAASFTEEIIINLQGDEPLINPRDVEKLIELMQEPGVLMGTLAVPIRSQEDYLSPTVVKVVCDDFGQALYFSRSPIPHGRDGPPPLELVRQHLGVYGYRREFLLQVPSWPPHPLERIEQLEQLRVLAWGHRIRVALAAEAHRGIDTPEDYRRFVEHWKQLEQRQIAA